MNAMRLRSKLSTIRRFVYTVSVVMLVTHPASAKLFRNAYVSFDLPEKWNCTLEQTEWVCRTNDPGQAEAIIILTAKEAGPSDSLSSYEDYLKKPRTIMTRTGQPLTSRVYEVQQQKISNLVWINGFHYGSEVMNYYTRYLATVKEKIAVLVTFSAHKLYYTKYSNDFFHAIQTLDVTASKALLTNTKTSSGSAGPFGPGVLSGDLPQEPGDGATESENQSGLVRAIFSVALILGAAGFYILAKKKKTKAKPRKK